MGWPREAGNSKASPWIVPALREAAEQAGLEEIMWSKITDTSTEKIIDSIQWLKRAPQDLVLHKTSGLLPNPESDNSG